MDKLLNNWCGRSQIFHQTVIKDQYKRLNCGVLVNFVTQYCTTSSPCSQNSQTLLLANGPVTTDLDYLLGNRVASSFNFRSPAHSGTRMRPSVARQCNPLQGLSMFTCHCFTGVGHSSFLLILYVNPPIIRRVYLFLNHFYYLTKRRNFSC